MLTRADYMDIHFLKREGLSIREIARRSGLSRNTVRKYLRSDNTPRFHPPERPGKVDAFKAHLEARWREHRLSAVRLLEEIRPMGYKGSVDGVRRFLRTLRSEQTRTGKLTVRFETAPGEQAQVDWQHAGAFTDPRGRKVKVYAFVMVLSFSRALFACFTTSMALPVLLACHEEAFRRLGGALRRILYDNMKQVRVGPGKLNAQLCDFAAHHGYLPSTHRAYRPRTKGKVERAIQYLDGSLLRGREFADLCELNAFAWHWCERTANRRIHATTKARPCDLLPMEKLQPARGPWPFSEPRKVDQESFVAWRGSRYSVPPAHAGKTVFVESAAGRVYIRSGELIVAEHPQAARAGQSVAEPEHLAEVWRLSVPGPHADKAPSWRLSFETAVPVSPLSAYAEVSA
ncbi:transposase [Ereboglobus sp. PH5-10]|uniref:IS21 family transposase n=1 Tax=Ereboglobus sp. PH5-10 TaxID=2940629 RepID=UPI002404FC05|nr:IS21 family transposase [Ereboglobus sp. PH5-10]MDF9828585.1 transposase [Ereboglobus sp. PH5-10]